MGWSTRRYQVKCSCGHWQRLTITLPRAEHRRILHDAGGRPCATCEAAQDRARAEGRAARAHCAITRQYDRAAFGH